MKVRAYEKRDAKALVGLVRALARYEKLKPLAAAAARRLIRDAGRRFRVLIAEVDGRAVGDGTVGAEGKQLRADLWAINTRDDDRHPEWTTPVYEKG